MRLHKWHPYEEMCVVNWCGDKVDCIPVPRGDGGCQLVPILGERRDDPTSARGYATHPTPVGKAVPEVLLSPAR